MLDTLKKDFEQLSLYTSTPGEGCTRLPFSAQAELSKKYIAKTMEGEGFDTAFDGVGNLRVRYSGSSPRLPALVIESHIDSVFNGGDFDGILGVLCGMEIFRSLKKKGFKPHRDILLVAFDGEEGCQFPSPYIGSRLATGIFDMEEIKLLRSPEGISYYDAALRAGYAPDTISQELLNTGIGEVFEIHVEQGEVLHKKRMPVGIVTSIMGFKRFDIRLTGKSAHPGTTPMDRRHDPMTGAVFSMHSLLQKIVESPFAGGTLTFGKIECTPNAVNIVPERVFFTIDIRQAEEQLLGVFAEIVRTTISAYARQFGLEVQIEETVHSEVVPMSVRLTDLTAAIAEGQGIPCLKMMSGAGHDITSFHGLAETALLFLPSIGGESHNRREKTEWEDIGTGCRLLSEVIRKLTG